MKLFGILAVAYLTGVAFGVVVGFLTNSPVLSGITSFVATCLLTIVALNRHYK